ncbi:hypothetical protein NMY22_g19257 [Coprinellus aureogranulatus]|nr:hypothetical protein NMY22_g19257 [Coprinellus aureogranulatus]
MPASYAARFNLAGRRQSLPGPGQITFDSGMFGAPHTSCVNRPNTSGWTTPVFQPPAASAPLSGYTTPFPQELVCDEVHREMNAAKPHLRMYTKDVTPCFLETWDMQKTMQDVKTPTWDCILDAATQTKASKRKEEER